MPSARRLVHLPLLFVGLLGAACDGDAGVEEVDRGAKPIEARATDVESLGLAAAFDVAGVELDAVYLVATGTIGDAPMAMLADEDGALRCAAVRQGHSMRWLDVDALAEGRIEWVDAHPSGIDAGVAALLRARLPRP